MSPATVASVVMLVLAAVLIGVALAWAIGGLVRATRVKDKLFTQLFIALVCLTGSAALLVIGAGVAVSFAQAGK